MLLLAGIAGVCGWVARGVVATPEATAQPRPAPVVVAAPPVVQVVMARPEAGPPAAPEEEPEDVDVIVETFEPAGEDVGVLIARVQQQAADHNAIYGIVTDAQNGEPLPGVTVLVGGRDMPSAQSAITDEYGAYKITGLPTGYVTATFFYAEITIERSDVMVSSLDPTPVFQRIDQSAVPVVLPPPPAIDDFSQGITLDDGYIRTIPVAGRTFEAVLGEAGDDEIGVAFSSGTSVENTYVIE